MKKKTIGALVIVSAIIWGAVIIGCAFILKGTPYKEDVILILSGGVISHMLFIWAPLGNIFRKKKEE
jgi:hypothetical protein